MVSWFASVHTNSSSPIALPKSGRNSIPALWYIYRHNISRISPAIAHNGLLISTARLRAETLRAEEKNDGQPH
jgi:hypothetical protein